MGGRGPGPFAAPAGRGHVQRRHRRRRHPLPPQLGRLRKEVPAGDDGRGRAVRRPRRRRLAGPPVRELEELAGPAGAALPCPPSTATTATAPSPTRRAARASTSRCTAWAWPPPTTTTTAAWTSTSPALGGNRLFHNEGGGRFADVTAKAGTGGGGFGTSAAFFDYDKDGKLDLFVTQLRGVVAREGPLLHAGRHAQVLLHARVLQGTEPRPSIRNRGDGTFEDVTAKAGLADPNSKALGVAVLDYDDDGWPDLFVANDTQPNKLYRNGGNGHVHRRGHGRGRGLQRGRRGPRGHGRRTPPTTTAPAGPASWSATSRTR